MKRFVLPELMSSYVLLVMGALIYLLESSDGTFAHLGAFGLFVVGAWIVFRPQKFTAGARASLKALLGAVRSTGSR
jgi:riboflavin transporter FmnP